jgi:hypothetical protein
MDAKIHGRSKVQMFWFGGFSFFLFMWVERFYGSHKMAYGSSPILVLHWFSLSVSVWCDEFSAHANMAPC